MFKKILFLAISALFAFGTEAQVGEIKVSDLPFGYTSIGEEQILADTPAKRAKKSPSKIGKSS